MLFRSRIKCQTAWSVFSDAFVYESFSIYCVTHWGTYGGSPTNFAWELTDGASDTFNDYEIGIIDYNTIVPACGDAIWKLDSVHSWWKRAQFCTGGTPPCYGTVPLQTIKTITWGE